MILRVETLDNQLLRNFYKNNIFSEEKPQLRLKDGVNIECLTGLQGRGADSIQVLEFSISIASAISIGVVANWIYDKFKNNKTKIFINRKLIKFDKDKIKSIIEEEIKIE